MKFSMTGQEKVTFNTGNCLIEVTVFFFISVYMVIHIFSYSDFRCWLWTSCWGHYWYIDYCFQSSKVNDISFIWTALGNNAKWLFLEEIIKFEKFLKANLKIFRIFLPYEMVNVKICCHFVFSVWMKFKFEMNIKDMVKGR
jgi:hypothetical protein